MADLATLDGRGIRVLVVDDDPRISELLVATLQFAGFVPTAVSRGADALRHAFELRPEVVILDVMLPDVDGFEVARRLREQDHRIPVLFLTARDGTDDKITGLTLGGDDYVTKHTAGPSTCTAPQAPEPVSRWASRLTSPRADSHQCQPDLEPGRSRRGSAHRATPARYPS